MMSHYNRTSSTQYIGLQVINENDSHISNFALAVSYVCRKITDFMRRRDETVAKPNVEPGFLRPMLGGKYKNKFKSRA